MPSISTNVLNGWGEPKKKKQLKQTVKEINEIKKDNKILGSKIKEKVKEKKNKEVIKSKEAMIDISINKKDNKNRKHINKI